MKLNLIDFLFVEFYFFHSWLALFTKLFIKISKFLLNALTRHCYYEYVIGFNIQIMLFDLYIVFYRQI